MAALKAHTSHPGSSPRTPQPQPSSATSGFFQPTPQIPPQYQHPSSPSSPTTTTSTSAGDPILPRLLALYLPTPLPARIASDIALFSAHVLHPSTLHHTRSAELHPPTLHPQTTFGALNTLDPLRTSASWRALSDLGIREGIVGLGFDRENAARGWNVRVWQFAKAWVWAGSAALASCPSAMTDGVAVLLGKYAGEKGEFGRVAGEVRDRLVSRWTGEDDDGDGDGDGRDGTGTGTGRRQRRAPRLKAWTSGQWMTERAGGSDVRHTETRASLLPLPPGQAAAAHGTDAAGMPLGPWTITGHKWFSSAADSDCAVLLAQSPRGLSCFYAPTRLASGAMNGVRIVRLKDKLGTKALPTAELELVGMRAWLVGEEGKGTKEISRVLNVTRIHTAVGQCGYWGRGLAVSRAFAGVRMVGGGGLLAGNAQHVRWMAGETVKCWAAMALSFFGVALLGVSEFGVEVAQGTTAAAEEGGIVPGRPEEVEVLLRVVTPVMKAQCSLASIAGLRACMESMGGVGYCENNEDVVLNVARLFRDANVGAIWEGTTSVIAEDVVRVLKGRDGGRVMGVLGGWIGGLLGRCERGFREECCAVRGNWDEFERLIRGKEVAELHWRGREVLESLETTICAVLLMMDAVINPDEIARAVARRWVKSRLGVDDEVVDWRSETAMDAKIFLGQQRDVKDIQAKL